MAKSGTKFGPVDLSSDVSYLPLLEASSGPRVVLSLGPVDLSSDVNDLSSDVYPLLEASSEQEWY